MQLPMGGFVTWLAIIGSVALGINSLLNGDIAHAQEFFTAALMALGLGRKIEKNK